jgi:REP element-mobilizing transposase RayT
MQRGNNRENIFQGNNDKKFFLIQLGESKLKFGFQLYGYALLDNHYHLLLKTNEIPLSKIMQRQNSLYSRYYNRVHDRTGHLFGLRYKAALVQDESYLFAVLRYIHWNPVKAGLTDKTAGYQWSSDSDYRHNRADLVDIGFIYDSISADRQFAINEYLRLIQDDEVKSYDKFHAIGDGAFLQSVKQAEGAVNDDKVSLDDLLLSVAGSRENYDQIKSGSRRRELVSLKSDYISKAHDEGYSYKEIAHSIKISRAAVSKLSK